MSATLQKTDLFHADDVRVVDGVAAGDALSQADAVFLDDLYQLNRGASALTMMAEGGHFAMAACGTTLKADACLRFMCPHGWTYDALLLIDESDGAYLCPLDLIKPDVAYRLIAIDRINPARKFAQATAACLTAGTSIVMADGSIRAVETLRAGDRVQTRDHGPQPIRWTGRQTKRADDRAGPVTVRQQDNALSVHPAQRLLLGTAKTATQAMALVVDGFATQQAAGFVDYVQLQFDIACAIRAEETWVESCLTDLRAVREEAIPSVPVRVGSVMGLGPRHAGMSQRLTAANSPSNLSNPDPSDTVPKTTPATASAARP